MDHKKRWSLSKHTSTLPSLYLRYCNDTAYYIGRKARYLALNVSNSNLVVYNEITIWVSIGTIFCHGKIGFGIDAMNHTKRGPYPNYHIIELHILWIELGKWLCTTGIYWLRSVLAVRLQTMSLRVFQHVTFSVMSRHFGLRTTRFRLLLKNLFDLQIFEFGGDII